MRFSYDLSAALKVSFNRPRPTGCHGGCNSFFPPRIDKGASTWCIEYVIRKEGTARDEGGNAGGPRALPCLHCTSKYIFSGGRR